MADSEALGILGFAAHPQALSLLQKELGQKERLLQQHQAKLEDALRKLSEASYQQVGTPSATDFLPLRPTEILF